MDIITINNKKRKKLIKIVTDSEFKIPNYNEYQNFYSNSYSVNFLKEICKNYKLKISGNKSNLRERIYNYLYESFFCIKFL